MRVRTNAETPETDCRMARQFGAEGIGLCRTEHMFFDAARISAMRQMILADDEAGAARGAGQAVARATHRISGKIFEVMVGPALYDPPARSAIARVFADGGWKILPISSRTRQRLLAKVSIS